MGMLDSNLQLSAAQAITATAASTNFLDLYTSTTGTTAFTPTPSSIFSVNETYFGEDWGIGKGAGTPRIVVCTGTAFATLTSMQVQFRGAPDNVTAHASGLRSDLTFVIYIETDTIPVAALLANTLIASFDWPKRQAGKVLPRFIDLNYAVTGSNATTGTVNADMTLGDFDAVDTLNQYGSNYKVAS